MKPRAEHRDETTEATAAARAAAVRRAHGMLAHIEPDRRLVDELIAERRGAARREPDDA